MPRMSISPTDTEMALHLSDAIQDSDNSNPSTPTGKSGNAEIHITANVVDNGKTLRKAIEEQPNRHLPIKKQRTIKELLTEQEPSNQPPSEQLPSKQMDQVPTGGQKQTDQQPTEQETTEDPPTDQLPIDPSMPTFKGTYKSVFDKPKRKRVDIILDTAKMVRPLRREPSAGSVRQDEFGDTQIVHKCPTCSYETPHSSHMKNHIITKDHGVSSDATADEYLDTSKFHCCPFCSYKAYYLASVKTHVRRKHAKPDAEGKDSMGQKISEEALKEYKESNESVKNPLLPPRAPIMRNTVKKPPKVHQCDQCDYNSLWATHLKVHMRRHSGERPHKCTEDGCDYTAAQIANLRRHIQVKHVKKDYNCTHPKCDYTTLNEACLKRHIQVKHERSHYATPRKCPKCEFKSHSYEALKKHIISSHM